MTAATENAKRLLADAEALLLEQRFASATALAILGIEEAGKVSILRELALARSNDDVQEAWRAYRSHMKKNVLWIVPELIQRGARTLEGLRPAVEADGHGEVLDYLKQLSIYTDCIAADRWTSPADVINEELARSIVEVARIMSRGDATSAEELRLWIKHMRPSWRQSLAAMKEGLLNWDREMRFRGLKPSGRPPLAEFLGFGNTADAAVGEARDRAHENKDDHAPPG